MTRGTPAVTPKTGAIPEAGLFADAEAMLVEVLGRIRPADHEILLPPLVDGPGPARQTPLWTLVQQHVVADAGVPNVIAGVEHGPRVTVDLDGADPQAVIVAVTDAAVSAATAAPDAATRVRTPWGEMPTRDYLLRLAVDRSLLAHYVAAYLGSTACPLPEELARQLLELTAPDLASWRALGIFREPLAVPPLASRRDTFLLTAGHLPHPLGH